MTDEQAKWLMDKISDYSLSDGLAHILNVAYEEDQWYSDRKNLNTTQLVNYCLQHNDKLNEKQVYDILATIKPANLTRWLLNVAKLPEPYAKVGIDRYVEIQ